MIGKDQKYKLLGFSVRYFSDAAENGADSDVNQSDDKLDGNQEGSKPESAPSSEGTKPSGDSPKRDINVRPKQSLDDITPAPRGKFEVPKVGQIEQAEQRGWNYIVSNMMSV